MQYLHTLGESTGVWSGALSWCRGQRPIDDCLEAELNHAFTVTAYLKLQDIDYVAGMALKIAERLVDNPHGPGAELWLGKCLDLSKAYKQMAIHPDRHLAVIFFHDERPNILWQIL